MRATLAVLCAACLWLASSGAGAQTREDEPGSRRRAAMTWVGGLSGAAVAMGAGALLGTLRHRDCEEATDLRSFAEEWGCGMGAVSSGVYLSMGLLPVATALGTYLPHRRNEGQAPWWVAATGSLAGSALAVVGSGVVFSSDVSDRAVLPTLIAAGLVSAAVPALALEWSHARRDTAPASGRTNAPARRRVTARAAPIPQGAWFGMSGTL